MKRISLTLERKLTLILVSFFFSMLAVAIIILSSLWNEYERRVYQINSDNTHNILSRADSSFSSAMLLSDIFIADGFFQDRLSAIKDGTADFQEVSSGITSRLSTMTDSSSFIVDIALSLPQGIIHSGMGVGLSSEAIDEAAAIAREAAGAAAWVGSDDGSIYLVRAIRRIAFLSLDELAILFIRIDGPSLVSALRSELPNAGISLILASDGRLLYSDYPGGLYSGSGIYDEIDDVRCFIYRGNLPASGFSYIDFVPSDQIFGNLAKFVAGTFSAFLLMLLAFLLVLHYMVRRIIGRVNSLREKMDAFEAGTYISSGQDSEEGGDEIAQLDDTEHLDIPKGVEVYEINGPFFFGLASRLEELEEGRRRDVSVRIIRMRKVSFMDSTGIRNLRSFFERTEKRGIRVILSGVNPQVRSTLHKFGLDAEIGTDYIFPHIIPALAKANEYLRTVSGKKN